MNPSQYPPQSSEEHEFKIKIYKTHIKESALMSKISAEKKQTEEFHKGCKYWNYQM